MLRSLICVFAFLVVFTAAQTSADYDLVSGRTPVMPFNGYLGDGNQLLIRDGMNGGTFWVEWDQPSDSVKFHVYYTGTARAFRARRTYPTNPSNDKNKWPESVHGGMWRLGIDIRMGVFPVNYYWWPNGSFACSDYDYYGIAHCPTLPGMTVQQIPSSIMIMSDWLTINKGVIDDTLEFGYNEFLNFMGTSGVVFTDINFQLNDSTSWNTIYSNPNTQGKHGAMTVPTYSWDQILTDVNNGGSIGCLPTYQPSSEPAYLAGRDSLMRGQFGLMTTGFAGPIGPRLADTATCFAFYVLESPDPYNGDIQLESWWTVSACVLATPPPSSKRSVQGELYQLQFSASGPTLVTIPLPRKQ